MDTHPRFLNGTHKSLCFFVHDTQTGMPPGAPVNHMKDQVLSKVENAKLNMLVEGVWDTDADLVVRSGSRPFPTGRARVHNFFDELQR